MDKNDYQIDDFLLNESFQRYVLHNTPEDISYWEAWIKEHPKAVDGIEKSKEIISFIATCKVLPKHHHLSDEVFMKLQQQIKAEEKQRMGMFRKIPLRYYGYAASLMILLALAVILRYNYRHTLSGSVSQYLEVIVPDGQRTQLLLPDGTKVWINSGSVFKYPTEFLKHKRDVYIEGEAFFKVAHDQANPFIVHTMDNLSVKVLGTEFNVKCYPGDKTIETTLVTGSIKLIKEDDQNSDTRELNLKPNEIAIYEKSSRNLEVSKLITEVPGKKEESTAVFAKQDINHQNNLEFITAWKDDALVFQDEAFEEIALKMERWFGVKITIVDEELKKERFTGKFVNKETIYQVLDIFNRSETIQYSTNNREIIITKRKKNLSNY